MKTLTRKQAKAIVDAWSTKADTKRSNAEVIEIRKKRIYAVVKGFMSEHEIPDNLFDLYSHALNEIKRLDKEHYKKQVTGEVVTHLTPTDVDGSFEVLTEPKLRQKCHVSWAYRGAVFIIVHLDDMFAYLDNPRHRRKTLLRVYRKDLRKLRE